ncbi:trypsin-like peptidase domain-containing protein [Candidatus Aquicultor secundus]|uniref:S1C family serine protease n=1 Tax=Candidatus Aquicultor secundus TaxID=1973895 RepID=UPI000A821970|nr:trypsin-like peptidase domain-containing protein [Candidatus Aquicultor secundus]NCO66042.1 trypsin-like serine protease [Solirubrobacter sp.]
MWKTALTSLVSAVIGGLLVFFALQATVPVTKGKVINQVVRESGGQKTTGGLTGGDIYKRFAPGVVHIKSVFTGVRSDFFGFSVPLQQEADGSGFIVDKSGLIVTNAHVVQDSNSTANKITVLMGDQQEVSAKLLGTDPSTDIAVLKIDPQGKTLRVLDLGDSSKLQVGDDVYAIGSPFELDGTLTQGIVSAINRTIDSPNQQFKIRGAIQTDAAVNPGNSGGPLLNAFGEVVGINSQIASNSGSFAGIAFAIPSNTVKEIVGQIEKSGKASHPWLGIGGIEVGKDMAKLLKLPVDHGVMIAQVVPGSPAEKAGLKASSQSLVNSQTGQRIPVGGDIIGKIDTISVLTMDDILNFVEKHKVGDRVTLEVYRGKEKKQVTFALGERPQNLVQSPQN